MRFYMILSLSKVFMEMEFLYFNKLYVYKRKNLKTDLIVNCARTIFWGNNESNEFLIKVTHFLIQDNCLSSSILLKKKQKNSLNQECSRIQNLFAKSWNQIVNWVVFNSNLTRSLKQIISQIKKLPFAIRFLQVLL